MQVPPIDASILVCEQPNKEEKVSEPDFDNQSPIQGARRADEGSLFKLNQYVRFILLQKSSSTECRQTGRALTRPSATLSHCFATGEGKIMEITIRRPGPMSR